jgi:hypothetical protein
MKQKIIFTAMSIILASLVFGQNPAPLTQSIALTSGWNIFSVYLNPDDQDMKTLFRDLIADGSLVKVQDETGNSLEDYGVFGGWTNNIGNLSPFKGYKVKVTRNCQLNLTGSPLDFPLEIPLRAGWNIMGYPGKVVTEGNEIIKQLIYRGTLVKVQDENGNAIENLGVFGGWTNNIGFFKPGEGYKIKVTHDEILTISINMTGKLTSHSNCKSSASSLKYLSIADTSSCVVYSFNATNNTLSFKHINTVFNCCPEEIYCKVSLSNDTIFIEESEKSHLCLCLCLFDLNLDFSAVEAKKYQVKIIEPYSEDKDQIIFGIDLTQNTGGSYCVTRKGYPYGM